MRKKHNHYNEPKFNFLKIKSVTQSLSEFRLGCCIMDIANDHLPAPSLFPYLTWEMIRIPIMPDMKLESWDFFLISVIGIPCALAVSCPHIMVHFLDGISSILGYHGLKV